MYENEILGDVECLLETEGLQSHTVWVQILCDLQQLVNLPVPQFTYL